MKSAHPLHEEELMAYLDGELRPELASIAATHLERCGECRATAADMRELSQQLAAWEIEMARPETPEAISSAVDAHVKAQKKRVVAHRRSWRRILGTRRVIWAGGALAAVLVVLATGLLNEPHRHPSLRLDRAEPIAQLQSLPEAPSKVPRAGLGAGTAGNLKKEDRFSTDGSLSTITNGPLANIDGQTNGDEVYTPQALNGPMIVRTAELTLTTKDFDKAHAGAEEILNRHGGYIGELTVNSPANSGRTLTATFRVPAEQLDAAMAELKKLGRVESESQSGEEVTQQYVDLQARLDNARHTEQRLSALLRDRTGKLSDVLAFEKEIDRVRGEIESMEAQRKSLAKQVSYATLSATMTEDYGQQLHVVPPSTSTRFHNAAVDGYRSLADGFVSLVLFLLSAGPSLLVWGAILFFVGRMIWKRLRRRIA